VELQPIGDVRCRLGESPYWWAERGELLFVDVHAGQVHAWSPATGTTTAGTTTATVAERVTFVVPSADGALVVGLRHGLATLADLASATGDLEPAVPVQADLSQISLNDARADARGRLWFGTMDREDREPIAGLYRWDAERGLDRVVDGVCLSNGIQFSPDGTTLYYVDSWTQRLEAFAYDVETGELGARRTVVEVPAEVGMPDGINVDSRGRIYVALYGGGALHVYLPDGTLDEVIETPVEFPTSCTFGGDDLRTLYVTTSSAGHASAGPLREVAAGSRSVPLDPSLDGAVLAGTVEVPGFLSPVVAGRPA
jgi:sugar lactone lactonase YvrE